MAGDFHVTKPSPAKTLMLQCLFLSIQHTNHETVSNATQFHFNLVLFFPFSINGGNVILDGEVHPNLIVKPLSRMSDNT